jgi:hypothetical protein
MSLAAHFERIVDRLVPAAFLVLGVATAASIALVGA